MLKDELKIFFTAVMFYSRIPVPKSTGFSNENLNKATRYFPLIGIIVGGFGALVFTLTQQIVSAQISIICSLCLMILLTGAFHEDGFSDFCDGFGGGYGKDQIIEIMKDSRIGTYGAIGLVMLLLSKFVLLTEISPYSIPLVFIVAHAVSRVNPALMILTSTYISNSDKSKSKPIGSKMSAATLLIALLFGLAPLCLMDPYIVLFLILAQVPIFIFFRYYVHKKIGGFTGDVLGALQQISEVGFYITYVILTR